MSATPPNPAPQSPGGTRNAKRRSVVVELPPPAEPRPERVESHRFLRRTLHGEGTPGSSQLTYWDGSDTVGETFGAIFDALNKSIPRDRPQAGPPPGAAVRRYTRR